ncbi:MAG TPA: alpha-L-fucosidase [Bryobacteraceae bacterium]|nr:alpha-L-fucosidase [Bryobacteraceae bacterium]
MEWIKRVVLIALAIGLAACSQKPEPVKTETSASTAQELRDKRLQWWRAARFGMFIHWGLYSVAAGEWKGKQEPWIGEWIMKRDKIPVAEYATLAKQFNPVKFNADTWVGIARNAGMKYLTITAKHHDGFAMFGSKVSSYNVVDATPWHHDPMKDLSAACAKDGIRFCFYYSQAQDWHDPNGVGNDWDYDESKKDFHKYFEDLVKPQVKELLTNYGPIGLMWFDTPFKISKEESQELAAWVHRIQPETIVNGRIGNGAGDYEEMGDNQIPGGVVKRDWEVPATMNDTWGYKKADHNWKSTETIVRQLVDIVGKGGNYLLNVGPTGEGVIPQPSVERLAQIGEWMKVNGDSIYSTTPSPFPYEFDWGAITTKPGKIFLQIIDWPKHDFLLYGLKSKVNNAYLLADAQHTPLKITQNHDDAKNLDILRISLPAKAPDPYVSVVALEIDGQPQVNTALAQQPDHTITLPGFFADVHHSGSGEHLKMDNRGVATNWFNKDEWLSWDFEVSDPGTFAVTLLTSEKRQREKTDWEGGHIVRVEVGGKTVEGKVTNQGRLSNFRNLLWPDVVSKLGTITIEKPGMIHLALKPVKINSEKKIGFMLHAVRLTPVR